jgi:uncharacterized membrane protein YphA (DoxX/SURF4 family)
MNKTVKFLLVISRIFVGIVFIYSGFVKGVDPLGSMYKFNDYFNAFGMEWATSLSFFLSILQSVIELAIGIAILLNLKIKITAWAALLFMAFYTPLTLILAINNPVHDCGCFGDALILTNWQTFWKNVILFIPVIFIFVKIKYSQSYLHCYEQWAGIAVGTGLMLIISIYSYNHLPVIDFRPYKTGTYIPEKMTVPEGAPADEWESSFIYKKNGVEKEFTLDKLPDSTWTFVDAKHILIKKGYEPPIHDFEITSPDGDDITDLLLSDNNYTFLLISYKLEGYNYKNQKQINKLSEFCNENGYNFYGITASSDDDIKKYYEKTGTNFDFYGADEITLKTVVRSNPGIVILKSGTIIDKWHNNDIPDVNKFSDSLVSQSISKYKKKGDNFYILLLIVSFGLMISVYLQIRKSIIK